MNIFEKFIDDESGATAIEYGLLAALIAVTIIGGATVIRDELVGQFFSSDGEVVKALSEPATE